MKFMMTIPVLVMLSAASCAQPAMQIRACEIMPLMLTQQVVTTQRITALPGIEAAKPMVIEGDSVLRRQSLKVLVTPVDGVPTARVNVQNDRAHVSMESAGALMATFQYSNQQNFAAMTDLTPPTGPKSFMYPWWVIIHENVEVGADGTRVFVYTDTVNSEHRMVALLLEGGPAYVSMHRVGQTNREAFKLEKAGHFVQLTWTTQGDRVVVTSVYNQPLPTGGVGAVPLRNWADFPKSGIRPVMVALDNLESHAQ